MGCRRQRNEVNGSMTALLVAGSYNASMTVVTPTLPRTGETLKGGAFHTGPGGKGANQAVGARRLGADVAFLVMLGKDGFGDDAAALLTAEGLPTSLLLRTEEAPTGAALIMVDADGRNQIAIAPGANALLRGDEIPDEVLSSASVLLCQLECSVDVFRSLAVSIRAAGGITVLNPAPAQEMDETTLNLCDFIVPNEVELASLTGLPVDDDAAALQAALRLVELGAANVIATLGDRGALWTDGAQARRYPSPSVKAVDTTGAGDAFCAGLAAALCSNADVDAAVGWAVRVGAFCVTRSGVFDGLGRPDQVAGLPDAGAAWDLHLSALHG